MANLPLHESSQMVVAGIGCGLPRACVSDLESQMKEVGVLAWWFLKTLSGNISSLWFRGRRDLCELSSPLFSQRLGAMASASL